MKKLVLLLWILTAFVVISASVLDHNITESRSFTNDDYELRDLLLECIDYGDWMLFASMLETDVHDWATIPDTEKITEAVIMGPSFIIYEMFLGDEERLRKDERISRQVGKFFGEEVGMGRMSLAFESRMLMEQPVIGFERAANIFKRSGLPEFWYIKSLPKTVNDNDEYLDKFLVVFTTNKDIPGYVFDYILNKTNIPLKSVPYKAINPKDVGNMKISLLSLADAFDNLLLWILLLNCPRYQEEISNLNTKIDNHVKQKIIKNNKI